MLTTSHVLAGGEKNLDVFIQKQGRFPFLPFPLDKNHGLPCNSNASGGWLLSLSLHTQKK